MRVAVVGKGGAGKSMLAGTMARVLAGSGRKVLGLDSDPMPGLAISLGMGAVTDAMLTEAAEKDREGRWHLRKGIGAARAVQRYSVTGPDGVRLLQFGKATEEGLAPVMGSLNCFYQVAHRLARTRVLSEWDVVGDLPAGPRQAAFDWAPYAEVFLVVVEPDWKSVLTARRIARIARSRRDRNVLLVANKIAAPADVPFLEKRLGDEIWASIPLDSSVAEADRRGVALIDHDPTSPAVTSIRSLVDALGVA